MPYAAAVAEHFAALHVVHELVVALAIGRIHWSPVGSRLEGAADFLHQRGALLLVDSITGPYG